MNIIFKTALIVVAHPDDEILGCGGLIAKYASEVDFHVLFLAEGSTCRYKEPDSIEAQSAVKLRNQCAENALTELGVKSFCFHDLPCGRLDQIPLIDMNKIVEQAIMHLKPDLLITHSDCDSNQDHVKICKSCMIASRPYNSSVKVVLSCEILSSTEWGFLEGFHPTICVELSRQHVEKKYSALSLYDSEIRPFPFPRSELGIEALARTRGMQFGFEYGEVFRLIRGAI